jgi:hypothetical protein
VKTLPAPRDEWIALVVFPFKAYVVLGVPLLRTVRIVFAGMPPWYGYSNVAFAVMLSYHLSVLVLLLGAVAQAWFSRPGAATRTLCFLALGAWFDWIAMDWATVR